MQEGIQYYYIHGLGSSKNSKKFQKLQKQYPNIICLDWTENDNINQKLEEWKEGIYDDIFASQGVNENVCIIASSTGANFAYQLKQLFEKTQIMVGLVLINPLLDISYLRNLDIMPIQLRQYLLKFHNISEALILISVNDEIINNTQLINDIPLINKNQIIIDYDSTHTFENLYNYYTVINIYVNNSIY